jgi:hypothetical protein
VAEPGKFPRTVRVFHLGVGPVLSCFEKSGNAYKYAPCWRYLPELLVLLMRPPFRFGVELEVDRVEALPRRDRGICKRNLTRPHKAFGYDPCTLTHDRDSIFAVSFDQALNDFGVRVLKTPVRSPTANAFCERLIGTIRRQYLDFLIPINERHLRFILKGIRCPLQSGTSTLLVRTWNPGTNPSECSGRSPQTSTARRSPSEIDADSWRATSRISLGKGGRLATDIIFAHHRLSDRHSFCGLQGSDAFAEHKGR